MVKVWFQRDKNTSEKIKIRPDSDIDDLKQEIFGKAVKGKYQATYKGQVLRPSAKVPQDTTDDMPIVFTEISDEPTPESQEFAAPGRCKKLDCEGRSCAKCNKCHDWHFRGNQEQWNWVCNWKNWNRDDKKRWCDDDWKLLMKYDDATCTAADPLADAAAADRDDDDDYLAYVDDLRAIYLAEDARDDDDHDRRVYLDYLSEERCRRDDLYLDYLADRDDHDDGHLCLCEKH
ncbi:unnamed protein product [Adineta steineri]|uniref:Ubiquitin-like domain-containing protein n=1 Tax=Adineta steineri TaxID=433720 RepID=A0A814QCP0_9BILA|nr:unnamed protein product [Adineta steineri]CAF4051732.1 unnamed protein product [Adineta steineri]